MNKAASKLLERAQKLERQAESLRQSIAAMVDLVDEPELNGSVIRFHKRYLQGAKFGSVSNPYDDLVVRTCPDQILTQPYHYAAIKHDRHWYVTGPKDGARSLTWNQLLEFVGQDYWSTIRVLENGKGE